MYGELVPVGGGDTIPLRKKQLSIGRRESCDIVLRFANVSAHHALMTVDDGYWFIKDLNSSNGVKINGVRIPKDTRKRLDPGDTLAVAKHVYEVHYSPHDLGAVGPPPADDATNNMEEIMGQSLLERAGLERQPRESSGRRHDANDNSPGKLGRDRTKPV